MNIDEYDKNGYTPLMLAAKEGDYDEVKRLLELGADPNIMDEDFGTSSAQSFASRKAKRSEVHRKVEKLLIEANPHSKKSVDYDSLSDSSGHSGYESNYSHDYEDWSGCLVPLFIILAIISGIPWAIWHFNLNPFNNEISAYRQYFECDEKYKNKCTWRSLYYITYEVNPDAQSVISWNSGDPASLHKLENCIVKSKKHWTCGEYYKQGFYDGKHTSKDSNKYRYVSKTKWWYDKL
jgi:hypothetical protein